MQLKPCPLCGREVSWISGGIECQFCGLRMRTGSFELTEQRWNSRIPKIVRCKDCKWGHIADRETPIIYDCGCPHHKLISKTYGNWFCADGELKK